MRTSIDINYPLGVHTTSQFKQFKKLNLLFHELLDFYNTTVNPLVSPLPCPAIASYCPADPQKRP